MPLPLARQSSLMPPGAEKAEQYTQRSSAMRRCRKSWPAQSRKLRDQMPMPRGQRRIAGSNVQDLRPHPERAPHSALRRPQDGAEPFQRAQRLRLRNWRHYRAFMPEGMIALFSGRYG